MFYNFKMGNEEIKVTSEFLIQNVKETKTINEHNRAIRCLLQLDNGDIASCSDDRRINIFSKDDFKLKQKIKVHENSVTYIFKMKNNQILSSSEDETIKIIKLTDNNTKYTIINTIEDNSDYIVQTIELFNGHLLSITSKKTFKIYELNTKTNKYENIKIFQKSGIDFLFELPNKSLLTTSYTEKKIKFWNCDNYSIIQMMNNISIIQSIELVCMLTDTLLGVCAEKFYVIDIENNKLIKKVDLKNTILCVFKLNNNTLLFGVEGDFSLQGNYFHFYQYKLNQEGDDLELISKKEKAHNTGINYIIQGKNNEIISCSEQRIKVWK